MALGAGRNLVIEVCVDSVESAVAAEAGAADRVELCANLLEGGTTPSLGMIELAAERLAIPLHVIIRPRGGDFCYSSLELDVMRRDILRARAAGAAGLVFGVLTTGGHIDVDRTRELIALARPLSVTFHRAFDMARDPYASLEQLVELGVDRLLTSGRQATAYAGLALIADLVRIARGRIGIMPAGGVAARLNEIVRGSGVTEVHLTATTVVDSPMLYRNENVSMGSSRRPLEYGRVVADAARLRELRRGVTSAEG